ncbi:MAG: transglycosylase SLT domain-containing protein [Bdellovibrionales bacterium]|nr:transglycosylase SLT domain-containing protein [Bdellovibrionales bacterium]
MAKKIKKKVQAKKTIRKSSSKVDQWLKRESVHQRKALENASRHFDKNDALTVHHLEAIYGQESSFGLLRRKRGMKGAAGDFQLERTTATRMGLSANKENDQRFDIDDASAASAKYLKTLDDIFSKKKKLGQGIQSIPIKNKSERIKFVIAAFNGGEGRIALAQRLAQKDGKAPDSWSVVSEYLRKAGASAAKVNEIKNYVEDVTKNSDEFSHKSKADSSVKNKKPKKESLSPKGGHWITKSGRHILIGD